MSRVYVGSKKEGTGKTGIIKDESGYYKIPFGKLNSYNDNGIFYKIEDLESLILNKKSVIGSRIDMGILRSEWKHPNFEGLNNKELVNRIFEIDLDRVSNHIKGVEFIKTGKTESGWENYPIYEVWGWVKPAGPYGQYLQESLDNPDENVSFSIRSGVTESYVGNLLVRTIIDISTWDAVGEQGVRMANQWHAAGIEQKDYSATVCLNGSCLTSIRKMVVGTENFDTMQRVGDSLERLLNSKTSVFNW